MAGGQLNTMTYAPKVWGHEIWVTNSDKYCGKVLTVRKGGFCSYHYHKIKDEVLLLIKGSIRISYCGTPVQDKPNAHISDDLKFYSDTVLVPGQAWHVPPFHAHQFLALEDSEIVEFSTQHFDSDSYRITTSLADDHYYSNAVNY